MSGLLKYLLQDCWNTILDPQRQTTTLQKAICNKVPRYTKGLNVNDSVREPWDWTNSYEHIILDLERRAPPHKDRWTSCGSQPFSCEAGAPPWQRDCWEDVHQPFQDNCKLHLVSRPQLWIITKWSFHQTPSCFTKIQPVLHQSAPPCAVLSF